jgi:tagatose-1,6-bisphosphate aldolase non-catalytic subunit AgaZ/GatZ
VREWVPEHREYVWGRGEVIVAGHYVEYKVEEGGHWEYVYRDRDDSRRLHRNYSYRDR